MKLFYKILLSISLPILGFIFAGIGWVIPISYPLNTVLFVGGLLLIPVGAIAPLLIKGKK
jgi:hypothetical protein